MSIRRRFTWKTFGIRTAIALLLVLVTYNPFGPSAVRAISIGGNLEPIANGHNILRSSSARRMDPPS
jgi:cell division septal protein FtsQ